MNARASRISLPMQWLGLRLQVVTHPDSARLLRERFAPWIVDESPAGGGTPDRVVELEDAHEVGGREEGRMSLELWRENLVAHFPATMALAVLREPPPRWSLVAIHGAAVAINAAAVVLAGVPGIGKSTAVSAFLRADRYFDDLALIGWHEDDPHTPMLLPIPAKEGTHAHQPLTPRPLAHIYLLERALQLARQRPAPGEAVTALLKQTFRPADETDAAWRFQAVTNLVESERVSVLSVPFDPPAVHAALCEWHG